MNANPIFEDDVKTMADVPKAWMVTFFMSKCSPEKKSKKETQELVMARSAKQFQLARYFLTGVPNKFELKGDMRIKVVFADFLSAQMDSRSPVGGPLIDVGIADFFGTFANGKFPFTSGNGCYEFVAQTSDKKVASHVKVNMGKGNELQALSIPLSIDTQIENNGDLFSANFTAFGNKQSLVKMFVVGEAEGIFKMNAKAVIAAAEAVLVARKSKSQIVMDVSAECVTASKRRKLTPLEGTTGKVSTA